MLVSIFSKFVKKQEISKNVSHENILMKEIDLADLFHATTFPVIPSSPNISHICDKVLVKEDASIYNYDNHSCASPNTYPIHDEGILVEEDTIIENHEILFSPSPSLPWEDILSLTLLYPVSIHLPTPPLLVRML